MPIKFADSDYTGFADSQAVANWSIDIIKRAYDGTAETSRAADMRASLSAMDGEIDRLAKLPSPDEHARNMIIGLIASRNVASRYQSGHYNDPQSEVTTAAITAATAEYAQKYGPHKPPPQRKAARGNFSEIKYKPPTADRVADINGDSFKQALGADPLKEVGGFDVNGTVLADAAKKALDDFAQAHKAGDKIVLIGFTSATGKPDHNDKLGMARSMAAMEYLQSKGIAAEDMRIASAGSTHLKVTTGKPENADNRRVTIIKDPGTAALPPPVPQPQALDPQAQLAAAEAAVKKFMKPNELAEFETSIMAGIKEAGRSGQDVKIVIGSEDLMKAARGKMKDQGFNAQQAQDMETALKTYFTAKYGQFGTTDINNSDNFHAGDPGVLAARHSGLHQLKGENASGAVTSFEVAGDKDKTLKGTEDKLSVAVFAKPKAPTSVVP